MGTFYQLVRPARFTEPRGSVEMVRRQRLEAVTLAVSWLASAAFSSPIHAPAMILEPTLVQLSVCYPGRLGGAGERAGRVTLGLASRSQEGPGGHPPLPPLLQDQSGLIWSGAPPPGSGRHWALQCRRSTLELLSL